MSSTTIDYIVYCRKSGGNAAFVVVGRSCGENACAGVVRVGRSKPLAKIDQLGDSK